MVAEVDGLELRREPRFVVDLEAKIHSEGGVTGLIRLVNLSRNGLQMECSYQLMRATMPNVHRPDPSEPIQLTIQIPVPDTDEEELSILSQVIYARRLAQDKFVIGCEFENLSEHSAEKLDHYLERHGRRM